jgi:hypothetical protein
VTDFDSAGLSAETKKKSERKDISSIFSYFMSSELISIYFFSKPIAFSMLSPLISTLYTFKIVIPGTLSSYFQILLFIL